MQIVSPKHLQGSLVVLSVLTLLVSLLIILSPNDMAVFGVTLLISSVALFSLSIGVKREEKWVGICGIIYFGLALLGIFLSFLEESAISFLIGGFLIASLFFISFINFLRKDNLRNKISIFPLIIVLVSFLISLTGGLLIQPFLDIAKEKFDNFLKLGDRSQIVGELGFLKIRHKKIMSSGLE